MDQLLQGCIKNDRKSQKALYQAFYGYGLSISLRYSEEREEAVELLNEAFMKVFKNLNKFDLSKPFKPWFRQITINTCINHLKKKKIDFSSSLEELQDQSASEEILSSISYQEILSMIRQLSPAYRTVFNLYVIEGYKHEEISRILDVSVGTSKSNLSKAKKSMQRILNTHFESNYERAK